MMPEVGSAVEIVLDNSFVKNYLEPEARLRAPSTVTIRGTVIQTPPWMKQFADITVLNSDTKAHNYIPSHKIISIGGMKLKQPKVTADKIFQVTSSKTGELYTVRQDGRTKRWSCTCVGFQFHKKCRHATRLAEAA